MPRLRSADVLARLAEIEERLEAVERLVGKGVAMDDDERVEEPEDRGTYSGGGADAPVVSDL